MNATGGRRRLRYPIVHVLGPEYHLNNRMAELLFPLPLCIQRKLVDLVEQIATMQRRPQPSARKAGAR
jgi:hypothetical protein